MDTKTLREDCGLDKTKSAQQKNESKEVISERSSEDSKSKKFDYGLEACDDSLLQEKKENEAWDTARALLDTCPPERRREIYAEMNTKYKKQRSMLLNLFELGHKE